MRYVTMECVKNINDSEISDAYEYTHTQRKQKKQHKKSNIWIGACDGAIGAI